MKTDTQYECMNDKCRTVIIGTGKCLDGIRCPRCNGPVFPFPYGSENNHKCFDSITDKNKLLTIELDSIDSVPKVFYQGEEITAKVKIKFEWETMNVDKKYCPTIFIQHADRSLSNKLLPLKTISIRDPFKDES